MFIIADGNNIAWAGFHSLRRAMGAETPAEFVRATLLGLTQSVAGLIVRAGEAPAEPGRQPVPPANSVTGAAVVFDEGRPLRRRTVFPAYQTGRESDPNFREFEKYVLEGIRQFSEMAAWLPVTVLRGINTEADDLVAALTLQLDEPVRIASTDRDFLQLVDERVSIYSPVKRLVITTANFEDATAPRASDGTPAPFPRDRYLDYRVASGDASDNLPGIPGVGTLTAAKLVAAAPIAEYIGNPRLLLRVLARRNARIESAFARGEAEEAITRNRMLMDLRLAAESYPALDAYRAAGRWDGASFRRWCTEQRIAALDLDAACRAFEAIAG